MVVPPYYSSDNLSQQATKTFSFSKCFPNFHSPLQKKSLYKYFPNLVCFGVCVCVIHCVCVLVYSQSETEHECRQRMGGRLFWLTLTVWTSHWNKLILINTSKNVWQQTEAEQHFFKGTYIWWELVRRGATIFVLPILGL